MIPNQWYAILDSSEVKRGKPVGVTRMGEKLVAWRDSQGRVTVMHDDKVRVVAAFAPVDDEHTVLYLRFYQKFMRTPGLRRVINALSMPFNVAVARQDRRVVETQMSKRTGLRMGEKLIQGDGPSSPIAGGGRS